MTIFGFNTDVKHAETVYHVQSEARQNDLLLETLVFVKGQCVGKHVVSYAQQVSQPDFSTEAIHELLKTQHKSVLDAIQQGRMEAVLSGAEVQDVGGSGLSLQWVLQVNDAAGVPASFRVIDSGQPAAGAEVVVREVISSDGQELARGTVDASGQVELLVPLTQEVLARGAVMVQATHHGKSATRKLRLKR